MLWVSIGLLGIGIVGDIGIYIPSQYRVDQAVCCLFQYLFGFAVSLTSIFNVVLARCIFWCL